MRLMKGFQLVNMISTSSPAVKRSSAFISHLFSLCFWVLFLILSVPINAIAQQTKMSAADSAYQKVLADRTAKIAGNLDIKDAVLYNKVWQLLITQYTAINAVQDSTKATIAAIKANQKDNELTAIAVKIEEGKKTAALKQLHLNFIAQLSAVLTAEQVEKIKDGMTYRILPVTWTAYLDMLTKLTQEQKDKIYRWLLEARELAMDEGSSDAKHAVFGKYKGRINNYLSAEGYDMKKEGEEWQKRIQQAKASKQIQN
jgi:Spy/CpxP family protein refolding chaperone